jgi:hypothetical protein
MGAAIIRRFSAVDRTSIHPWFRKDSLADGLLSADERLFLN